MPCCAVDGSIETLVKFSVGQVPVVCVETPVRTLPTTSAATAQNVPVGVTTDSVPCTGVAEKPTGLVTVSAIVRGVVTVAPIRAFAPTFVPPAVPANAAVGAAVETP